MKATPDKRPSVADPVAEAEAVVEAALTDAPLVDLSWLAPVPADGWTLAGDALQFVASLTARAKPTHVVEFGPGLSTRVLARACRECRPPGRVTAIDHDVEFMRIAERELRNEDRDHVSFQAAPLVLRRCFGTLVPVYRVNRKRFASPLPADVILIDGPPARLGGREGTLYQALDFARPGSIVVLDDANRAEEAAVLESWRQALGEDISVREFPEFKKGLAVVIVCSTRRRCGLNDVRADRAGGNPKQA